MNKAEKEQKERLQRLVNGDIPTFSVQFSYKGEQRSEEESKAEFEQFIARVNRRRQQRKNGRFGR